MIQNITPPSLSKKGNKKGTLNNVERKKTRSGQKRKIKLRNDRGKIPHAEAKEPIVLMKT
jgi:hypothetical protein